MSGQDKTREHSAYFSFFFVAVSTVPKNDKTNLSFRFYCNSGVPVITILSSKNFRLVLGTTQPNFIQNEGWYVFVSRLLRNIIMEKDITKTYHVATTKAHHNVTFSNLVENYFCCYTPFFHRRNRNMRMEIVFRLLPISING